MVLRDIILQKRRGPMKSIAQRQRKWKVKVGAKRESLEDRMKMREIEDIDVRVSMIQALIPVGLEKMNEELQKEVCRLAGTKYEHGKENVRWGGQSGSVYLLDQKVPMRVPRVRNTLSNTEVPLRTYQKFQEPYQDGEQVFVRLLNGLSTHKYRESAELIPEVFGISASNVSRRFKMARAAKLRQLQERRLERYDFVAIFVDGKRFADEGLIVVLGITIEGAKIVLGIAQMSTENSRALSTFFEKLIGRGLRGEDGIVFVIDGAKGITKAVRDTFPETGVLQRCVWHKIENIVSYLPKGIQALWRSRLRAAYQERNYESACRALEKCSVELYNINPSAADSLREGLEETLTLHRLEMNDALGKSFSSTNCIESVMSQLGQYTDKVDRWRGGAHLQRWAASGLLALEPRLRKVKGFRALKLLREKLREESARRRKNALVGASTSDDLATGIHNAPL